MFFESESDWYKAKTQILEQSLRSLLIMAAVDKFEHWLYTHPGHGLNMRQQVWKSIERQFTSKHEAPSNDQYNQWIMVDSIFLNPFQMIERGLAKLAALEVWSSYLEEPSKAVQNFKKAMDLGNSQSVTDIYSAAGARADISRKRIKSIATFVKREFNKQRRRRR